MGPWVERQDVDRDVDVSLSCGVFWTTQSESQTKQDGNEET